LLGFAKQRDEKAECEIPSDCPESFAKSVYPPVFFHIFVFFFAFFEPHRFKAPFLAFLIRSSELIDENPFGTFAFPPIRPASLVSIHSPP
jgi:hypothetical protein